MLSFGILCFGEKQQQQKTHTTKKLYQWSPPTVHLPCSGPEWNESTKTILKASFIFPPEEQSLWKAVEAELSWGWDILCPSFHFSWWGCLIQAQGGSKFIQPSQGQYYKEVTFSSPRVGSSLNESLGALSPVLDPWLLKISKTMSLFKGTCIFTSHCYLQQSATLHKTPGQKSSVSRAFILAASLYRDTAWAFQSHSS